MCRQGMLRTVTSGCLLWTRYDSVNKGSDEWLPAVNKVCFCDSGQWRVAACSEQGMILWIRGTDEWLPALNSLGFYEWGQWRVVTCSEQGMILWIRAMTSACLLWTRYVSVTQNSDEWLASVNTVWFFEFNKNVEFIDSLVVLSLIKNDCQELCRKFMLVNPIKKQVFVIFNAHTSH